jgi:hypothetical protein
VFELMNLVVCRVQPSIQAAYQDNKAEIETSITAVYDKLSGIGTVTSRALDHRDRFSGTGGSPPF